MHKGYHVTADNQYHVILENLPVASTPKPRHPGMFAGGKHIRDLNYGVAPKLNGVINI